MRKQYSANQLLSEATQELGIKLFMFDDPERLGPEIKLVDKNTDCEIDAILLHKNIVCLAGIDGGATNHVDRRLRKFFERMNKTETLKDLRLQLKVTVRAGKRIDSKKEAANKLLEGVKNHLDGVRQEYDMMLRKLFFCPSRRLDQEEIALLRNQRRYIIDKDIYDYFQEVLNRLHRRFLFADFMHFLGIRKVDLRKKSPAKMRKPKKSEPFSASRLELEKDRIITYSLPVRVEDIVKNVTVLRLAGKYDKKGFQRMVKTNRLETINGRYLSKNETFPNNVIVALDPEVYRSEDDFYDRKSGELTFLDEFNSLIIIDGQHRFFSLVKGGKSNRHILVTLIFFNKGSTEENHLSMVRMFYEINKTQERIDPNLSFALKAKIDPDSPENFWYSVFTDLDKRGFFAKRFSFKETTMRKKGEPKSIVSVVTYGGVLKLNEPYKRKGIEVDGLSAFYELDKQQNVIFASNMLKNYFDIVEEVLHDQGINKDSLTPREIGALIRLLRHFMISRKNELRSLGVTRDIVKTKEPSVAEIKEILSCIPLGDATKLEYAASNWAAVEGYMLRSIHKQMPGFGNKGLLSKKGLEVYEEL